MLKCTKCGAELPDGVSFCRECGAKVEPQKKYCRECGNNVPLDARFCSHCGADLTAIPTQNQTVSDEDTESHTFEGAEYTIGTPPTDSVDTAEFSGVITIWDKTVAKLKIFWDGLGSFPKKFTILLAIILLLLLVAFASHNAIAISFSIIQIVGCGVLMLWHRGILKAPRKWLQYATLVVVVLFSILNVMSYSWVKEGNGGSSAKSTVISAETNNAKAMISPPYSVADCVSRNYDEVKNDFILAGFSEIHTKALEDLSYTESDKINTVESVSINGDNDFTGTEQFGESAMVEICYHTYRKVTVAMDVVFLPNFFFDKYAVALYLDNEKIGELAHGEDKTFSLEVYPNTYTFVFQKKDDASCTGSIELDVKGDVNAAVQISCQSDSIRVETLYVEKLGEVHDGEIMMPQALSAYRHKNYLDVQNTLEGLGYTNISTEILYDIYWGWTDEGEVESVSINGNTDCVRGDIFPADAPIIITYHMKEADDPLRVTVATKPKATMEETTLATSKEYAIDKDLVVTKCERDAEYTTMYNVAFAEVDSNGNQVHEYSFGHCINPHAMGKEFNAIGDLPSWFYVGATVHVKANYSYDGLSEKDTTVTEATKATPIETEAPAEEKPTVVLPEPLSKLGKDYDSKSASTVYYINVDGIKNKPTIQQWKGATVTDGVAEYLKLLTSKGFKVRITDKSSNTPYAGFTCYETYFEVSNSELTWTMYLNIQSEKYVEYELDINLD